MSIGRNTAAVGFPQPSAGGQDPTHFGIRRGGVFLLGRPLTDDVAAFLTGANVRFPAEMLVLTLPAGQWTAAGALDILEYYLDNNATEVSLHDDDPGDNGANELTGNNYARVTVPAGGWTVTQ